MSLKPDKFYPDYEPSIYGIDRFAPLKSVVHACTLIILNFLVHSSIYLRTSAINGNKDNIKLDTWKTNTQKQR